MTSSGSESKPAGVSCVMTTFQCLRKDKKEKCAMEDLKNLRMEEFEVVIRDRHHKAKDMIGRERIHEHH